MAVTLVYRFQDSESDVNLDALSLVFPATPALATLQAYADGLTPLVDALTGAQIVGIEALYSLTIEGTAKAAPVAGSLNERGGLIGFEMSIPGKKDSLRIPAILPAIMSGDSFSLADADVEAFTDYVTGAQEGIEAINSWVASYETPIYAKKSFRRK